MLTEQQKQFCHEYLKDFSVSSAMKRVGYSEKTANHNGYKMLRNPEIAFYLKELMDGLNDKHKLTADMVIEQMRRLAFSDIIDYYNWSEKKKCYVLKALDALTAAQRAPIASYEPRVGYTFYSKDPSLDKLAKYFKLYSEIDQTITNFVLMPELKLGGKSMVFNIGEPVTKRDKKG